MTIYQMDSEEEALYRSYHAIYYVQSPSTICHSTEFPNNVTRESISENFAANSLILHGKNFPYDDLEGINHDEINNAIVGHDHDDDRQGRNGYKGGDDRRKVEEEEEDDGHYFEFGRNEWWRIFFFSTSSSSGWKILQISWRFVLSIVIALVVFYVLTKPPPPNISIKIWRVSQFELTEGIDATGVTTKILTCNCSVGVRIDNNSKFFRLHVHPPLLAISFGNLPFAVEQGNEVEVGEDGVQYLRLQIGTRNKPMYGAGRSMQDLLDSDNGLPLEIHIKLRSSYDVIWDLMHPKFHNQAECLVVVGSGYDKKHKTHKYISKCTS
ncbi:OLC1v1001524C1 [Oldenlandia corymbosa var. corymbosa]|uniref:OLC1v1001524C1 n=1 Tax=Oldenlandia corymbosa var. corymbosa TaxID=529605 RepID=A0AAV1D5G5_OLDCO|nr:OLC1v1001524C1 [Oldenlandia corymbosa var. corymbosa]